MSTKDSSAFFDIRPLESELNPDIFSWNSVYGVLMLLILIGIAVLIIKKIAKALVIGVSVILSIEILHVFAFTPFATENLPVLQSIFKYDVLQALAQLCVGTPLADFLLHIQAFINALFAVIIT